MRAKKQCANVNCNVRIIGKTYCNIHSNNYTTSNNNAQYIPQWNAIREFIRQRDSNICYLCGASGSIVDHIIPKVLNGSDDPSNLACICQPCHTEKTAHDGRIVKREPSHIDYTNRSW